MTIIIKTGAFALLAGLAACGNAGTAPDGQSANASSGIKRPAADTQTHSATGTVEKVAAGQVTIAHGPVQTLQWPAMTMAFSAPDAALLGSIRPGDGVAFSFTMASGAATLTAISKK